MEKKDFATSVKKVKLLEANTEENEEENQMLSVIKNPEYAILHSPITVPMLLPEIWETIFTHLPIADLETVMNTCPEWNKILAKRKPRILFQKVISNMRRLLPRKDAITCRLVSRASKAGIEQAYPEMAQEIRIRCNRDILMNAFLSCVSLYVWRRTIIIQREAQGLPPWMDNEVYMQEEYERQRVMFHNALQLMFHRLLPQ